MLIGAPNNTNKLATLNRDSHAPPTLPDPAAVPNFQKEITMVSRLSFPWLQDLPDWQAQAKATLALENPGARWQALHRLANTQMDLLRTARIDLMMDKAFPAGPGSEIASTVKIALLGTSTLGHLHAGIRVGLLRRRFYSRLFEPAYGQVIQEICNNDSPLYSFAPDFILLSEDARHAARPVIGLTSESDARHAVTAAIARVEANWKMIHDRSDCIIFQQTLLPILPPVLGGNEHRLAASQRTFIRRFNDALRESADRHAVDLLAIDALVERDGANSWHDVGLWCSAKQEISPRIAHLYGEALARLVAARKGRTAKCLVLDLDNTLWGGVIGDDGIDGIVLGSGSPRGEGFLYFQEYVLALARRGIIIAVVSKNDHANAIAPFESHPDMLVRKSDIACFIANWDDKATNIRRVADELNIGLDSLVFIDDNPFERQLVRRELSMVEVPEVPESPADIPFLLADAGYFEGISVTTEDYARTESYLANKKRLALQEGATDLQGYLKSLEMQLVWSYFDTRNLPRITQLINKTNQFNLTTTRYTEEEVRQFIESKDTLGLHFRLIDKFGDSGIIGIIISRASGDSLLVESWLMSCRVLGREVERAMFDVLCRCAISTGHKTLRGLYTPTQKNGMVKEHYDRMGFSLVQDRSDGSRSYIFDLQAFRTIELPLTICEADSAAS